MSEQNHSVSIESSSDTAKSRAVRWVKQLLKRRGVLVIATAAAVVLAVIIWLTGRSVRSEDLGPVATATVEDLVVSITESGELEAEKRKIISNELSWPVIIKSVAEQGMVKPGQVIIEFECKELIDAIERQELDVTTAKDSYTQARENLLLKEKEMANSVSNAEEAVANAKADLLRYDEKGWPIKRDDAESAIQLAEEDLMLAEKKLAFKIKANQDPELSSPYSVNEIKADKLAVTRLKLGWKKAKSQKEMLLTYDHPKELRRLKRAVIETDLKLERVKLQSKTQMSIARSTERTRKSALEMKEKRLGELLEEKDKLIITAEAAGLVVYNTGGNRWRPSTVSVQVGEKINPRQQLMIIPDMTTLQIKTKVFEARINEVKPGLEAYITLGSERNVKFAGRVKKVAVLPDSQNRWLNPGVKVFDVLVTYDDGVDRVKPGMSAEVELILSRLPGVLTVPIAAVFTEQEKTYCYRLDGNTPVRTAVQVGKTNDKKAQILFGLSDGDRVLLTPPRTARTPADQTPQPSTQQPATAQTRPATAPASQPATAPTQPATTPASQPGGSKGAAK